MTSASQTPCPNCGNLLQPGASFCPYCGSALAAPPAREEQAASAEPVTPTPAPAKTGLSQCKMIIGYLVPHRCENPALGRCVRCGRFYCEEHVDVLQEGLVCLACQQGLTQPVALPLTAQSYDPTDIALFDAASRWDEDDDDTFADLS